MKEGMDLSMGNRQSTIDCMAKIVRALMVCRQVTVRTLADKADVSVATVQRVLAGLKREGLVVRVRLPPGSGREYVYGWVDEERVE